MSEEEMVANIVIGGAIDAMTEIMGERGCAIVFKEAGLSDVYENPPPYDFNPCITERERDRMVAAVATILGFSGALGVWRRIGYVGSRYAKEIGHVLDGFEELTDPDERFLKALELWSLATGEGRIVKRDDGKVDFDVYDCLTCKNYTSKRPMCAITAGALQFISDWAYGKKKFVVRETKCKAMGDETCYYSLTTWD
jgi:predicted hydrocarbon binding protein